MKRTETFSSEDELFRRLNDLGIKTENWGKGNAKNVSDLLEEIEEKETVLYRKDNRLLREIKVAGVNVFFRRGKDLYRLREDRQDFADGRTRTRSMAHSLAEKFKGNELPENAARRALREELKIEGEIDIKENGIRLGTDDSLSYPGLKTRYTIHEFTAFLSPDQFSADGYEERNKKMTVRFVWERIER
jgi:hypothetical protein